MLVISCLGTLLVFVATVLPMFKHTHWIVRGMDFPRLQVAFFSVILICVHFLILDLQITLSWLLILVTALCGAWQLWWILPYTFVWPKEVKQSRIDDPSKQLSILTSNVLKTNHNSAALIKLVEKYQPDVLVTLESDKWWEDQLEVLETEMPYSVKCPLDNLYGMHVYSKLPFAESEICYLVEENVPSIHVSLELRTNDKVRMYFLHPAPPSPTENTESTERDAELITIARSVAGVTQPVIITGDLNDVAWSATTRLFRKISGLLDPRVGRGIFNTFHVDYPLLRWPLDHLFHSSHFTIKQIRRLPSIDSDHFPLFTQLVFNPSRGSNQTGLTASKEDYRDAKKISDKKGTSKSDVPTLEK